MKNNNIVLPSVRLHPLAWLLFSSSLTASAGGIPTLDEVVVSASTQDLIGTAASANEGTVSAKQLETRPLLRPGEVLEVVPGVIISQHSGDGKANQYYLRGFNLDHGTDFFTSVNGMPVNLPTNAHGQGYADLNFLIPELVERMQYKKGTYYADEGDFSAAGAAHIDYFRQLSQDFADISVGQNGYRRTLLAGSPKAGDGNLLYAFEWSHNDGPWEVPEGFRKLNGVLRYSQGGERDGFSVTAMAYDADWRSTDQVPQRAIDAGLISRFGSLDPSDGGKARRYSLSGDWAKSGADSLTKASAYFIHSSLSLFSNFEFNLNFPAPVGDQFEQSESRDIVGFDASHTWYGKWSGRDMENTFGVQGRFDDISPVGLYRSVGQQRVDKTDYNGITWPAVVREDRVKQGSFALYAQNTTTWNDRFRSVAGLRGDFYRFKVDSSNAANSGELSDHIFSPKLSLIFGPWNKTEYYLNFGYGFHSNDARGTTMHVDPADPAVAVQPVTPLVRAKGAEIGVRSALLPHLQSSLSLWRLDLVSELVFVGDAGTTEPGFPSRRSGVEWANYWTPLPWLTVDADLAVSRARYSHIDPTLVGGDHIPGAIEKTLSVGVSAQGASAWSGGLRLRYFGPRPLIEDNSVRSKSSTLVNLRAGYQLSKKMKLTLDVLNLFNSKVSDIDYYYASRLAGEAAPVDDIHTHPSEPRTARLSLRIGF
ncbi:TonB-dependent receptor [Sulfurimicrobium lacus]|uniref:TonB-dependent receptor n=1 Tax=Sulfurimicrobium lacus TaxID=2715678 RepID=A0A6F8VAT9_9PROT|nr:TonB-dependent receptor [Sulfurimicrobium lacus]BCB26082.1 TonB-dependent receptor [Sulfurimicrobium lacus]